MTTTQMTRRNHWQALVAAALFALCIAALGVTPAYAADHAPTLHGAPVSTQGSGDDDDLPRLRGLVEQMPTDGRIGDWVIGGQTVVATAQTEFDETEGALAVGVCAKVEFVAPGSNVARAIDSEPAGDCDGSGDDGPGDGPGDDDGAEVYGIVETMPVSGTVGAWTVSSQVYTVTAQSELKEEYGAFDIGRCVKIHLVVGTTDTVREMETERSYKCDGRDDDDGDDTPPVGVIGRGELYGELVSFPTDLIGSWLVGTLTFSATADTEFKTANGQFTIGEIVKVEFYIMQDGTFLAREIKTAMPDWDDDDDHGDDDHGHHEGHAFGVIEQLPESGLIGTWVVAGIPYSVTEQTELKAKGGTFAISETVKIEFRLDSSGGRVATEIKLKFPQGDPGQEEATFVGFVEAMPDAGYVGQWIVSGTEFSGTVRSKFKEDHGALTVGAYVKVEYRLVNGVRVIHEMETEVPPGAGDDDHVGAVESLDDSVLTAGAALNSTWVIGGRSFVVTAATRVDGDLAASDTAWVNSYPAADGTQVATRIEGVTLNSFIYLPTLRR